MPMFQQEHFRPTSSPRCYMRTRQTVKEVRGKRAYVYYCSGEGGRESDSEMHSLLATSGQGRGQSTYWVGGRQKGRFCPSAHTTSTSNEGEKKKCTKARCTFPFFATFSMTEWPPRPYITVRPSRYPLADRHRCSR